MAAPKKKKGGSFLTKDVGPLPGWGWVAVAAGGIIMYRHMAAGAAGNSTAAAGQAATASPGYDLYGAGYNAGLEELASALSSGSSLGVGGMSSSLGSGSGTGGAAGTMTGSTGQQTPATPAPAPTAAAAPAVSSPAGTVPNPLAGWTYLPTYAAYEQARAAGETIDYTDAGSTALHGYFVGGKQVGAPPPAGSRWYVKA